MQRDVHATEVGVLGIALAILVHVNPNVAINVGHGRQCCAFLDHDVGVALRVLFRRDHQETGDVLAVVRLAVDRLRALRRLGGLARGFCRVVVALALGQRRQHALEHDALARHQGAVEALRRDDLHRRALARVLRVEALLVTFVDGVVHGHVLHTDGTGVDHLVGEVEVFVRSHVDRVVRVGSKAGVDLLLHVHVHELHVGLVRSGGDHLVLVVLTARDRDVGKRALVHRRCHDRGEHLVLARLQGAVPALRCLDGTLRERVLDLNVVDRHVGLVGDDEAVDEVLVVGQARSVVRRVGVVAAHALLQLQYLLGQVDPRQLDVLARADRDVHRVDLLHAVRREDFHDGVARHYIHGVVAVLVHRNFLGVAVGVGDRDQHAVDRLAVAVDNLALDLRARCLDVDNALVRRLVVGDLDRLRPILRLGPALRQLEVNLVVAGRQLVGGEVAVLVHGHRREGLGRVAVGIRALALHNDLGTRDLLVQVINEPAVDGAGLALVHLDRLLRRRGDDARHRHFLAVLDRHLGVARGAVAVGGIHNDNVVARLQVVRREIAGRGVNLQL